MQKPSARQEPATAQGRCCVAAPSKAVTLGLFVAWALHDLEELLTMPGWSRGSVPKFRERFPRVPRRAWQVLEVSPAQAAVAIGLVGMLVAGAAADGVRSGGR